MKIKKISGLILIFLCITVMPIQSVYAARSIHVPFAKNYTIKSIAGTPDGSLYLIFLTPEKRAKLIAYSPNGKQKWSVLGEKNKEMTLATNELGDLYIQSGTKVTAYNRNGKVKWKKTFDVPVIVTSGKDVFIAYSEYRMQGFTYDGKAVYDVKFPKYYEKFIYPDKGSGFWSMESDNTVDLYQGNKKRFTATGTKGSYLEFSGASKNGKVLYMIENNNVSGYSYVLAYTSEGKLLWKTQVTPKAYFIKGLRVLDNGTLVTIHSQDKYLTAISEKGEMLWTVQTHQDSDMFTSFGNLIYLGTHIYDANGKVIQTVNNFSGNIYVTGDGSLVFVKSNSLDKVKLENIGILSSWAADPVTRLMDSGIINGCAEGAVMTFRVFDYKKKPSI